MYCATCQESWPGHKRCPACDRPLVDLKQLLAEAQLRELPRLLDLAHQFDLGRAEALAASSAPRPEPEEEP